MSRREYSCFILRYDMDRRSQKKTRIGYSGKELPRTQQVIPPSTSFTSICVAGHSATLVRARSMLRTGHSVPDLTTSIGADAGHSATLVRARPVLRADWCLPFNKNLPKEIATHFVDLSVKWYNKIAEFLCSIPDLLNKSNDVFMAYITSLKLISEQAITLIGVYNYCQDLNKFVKGSNQKNTFFENVKKARRYLQKEEFARRVKDDVLEVFEEVCENVMLKLREIVQKPTTPFLPKKCAHVTQEEELDVTNEDLMNLVTDASDIFEKGDEAVDSYLVNKDDYKTIEKNSEMEKIIYQLGMSEGSNNPDPDKISEDRCKLLNEGVFGLNKFMLSTELPKWKVCEILKIFLAQVFANKIEIGQLIFIGPDLYLFAPFTIPVLTIPTSDIDLNHVPRLIRTLLCLQYNLVEKIKRFMEFRKEGQENIVKSKSKYATGFIPERRKAVTFAEFLSKILEKRKKVNSRERDHGRGHGRGIQDPA
ncbi:10040_t:CDS:2 [Ambispora leptoticha]|uniref:10040_t:CDS:1 n=1 Tax=Ambispora leptoticha TaxID=144679 RepID=A0A9N9A1J7_9GLOM|nr:10040_t:CDS:2 [Ambispora leptoticha]